MSVDVATKTSIYELTKIGQTLGLGPLVMERIISYPIQMVADGPVIRLVFNMPAIPGLSGYEIDGTPVTVQLGITPLQIVSALQPTAGFNTKKLVRQAITTGVVQVIGKVHEVYKQALTTGCKFDHGSMPTEMKNMLGLPKKAYAPEDAFVEAKPIPISSEKFGDVMYAGTFTATDPANTPKEEFTVSIKTLDLGVIEKKILDTLSTDSVLKKVLENSEEGLPVESACWLHDATAIGQLCRGSGAGSRYVVVALGKLNVAARLSANGTKASLRIEEVSKGKLMLHKDAITNIGVGYNMDGGKLTHASAHVNPFGTGQALASVAALLAQLHVIVPFDEIMSIKDMPSLLGKGH